MMRRGETAMDGLLEREYECDALARALAAASTGDGTVVALEGEAGIGKSALLAYAMGVAADTGMRVLTARGGELEQDFGYGVVRQLFDAPLGAMTSAQRRRLLSGAAVFAAPALSTGAGAGAGAAEPGSVLHGLYWLTANLAADRPLVIAIDDAHWADSASIAFLNYIGRRVEGLALVVLYATRVGEGAGDVLPAFADAGFRGTVLRPGVLGERATIELIGRSLAGESCHEFAQACRAATAGNPFLLQELLRALHADGIAPARESCARVAQIAPGTISRAILARLRRLGTAAMELAFAIAVLGRSAELRHAAALAALDPEATSRAADALTRAAIVGDRRPLEFIHPIVRTAIYAEIPAARRAAMHKRAAALLERDAFGPAELAPHLMASEPAGDPHVVQGLRAAAAEVRDGGAPGAACAYLRRALAEPPSAERRGVLLYELGSAELPAGHPQAIGHLRGALAGDLPRDVRVAAAVELVVAFAVHGQRNEGTKLLDGLIAEIAADGDPELAMQIDGLVAGSSYLDGTPAAVVRARLGRYSGLRGDTLGEQLLLSAMAFEACHRAAPAAMAIELAERALTQPRRLLERYPHSTGFPLAVWALVLCEQLERADDLYTLAVESATARGSLVGLGIAAGCRSQVRFRLGRIAEAEAEARDALDVAGSAWLLGRPMMLACALDALVERADGEACRAYLAEQGIDADLDALLMASRLLYSRGHMRLAHGDPAGALRDFEQILERDARLGMATPAIPTYASAALALHQLGDQKRARTLAAEELVRARSWGTPSALSFALRTAGIVTGGEAGLAMLARAAAAVADSPARYERARSLTEYGAALRRAGHRTQARVPLREALALADACGARRTAGRAREELLATGARPRRIALSGADALTPSERRVARLAVDGLSNREIAQTLFVTIRTVEGHLTQSYMKLDIAGREQLAAALG